MTVNSTNERTLLYLSKTDLISLGGNRSDIYVESVEKALKHHADGEYVQPLKPYLRVDKKNGHIADRIIAMPAHIGNPGISGIKWIGSKYDNPSVRGMERASALVILNEPDSNYPISIMEGSLISGMRTAAVSVLAARYLAKDNFQHLTVIGCGIIARMHILSMMEQFSSIRFIHIFDISNQASSKMVEWIEEHFPSVIVEVTNNPKDAICQGEVIIPCTVTDHPYISYDWLNRGALVINVSIMDVEKEVFLRADKVIVDDWEQSNREKKIINQLVEDNLFSRDQLYAELGEILSGRKAGRENSEEVILVNPMGMALVDIACAESFYRLALERKVGITLPLY